ncbi:MAG: polymer-forming cytoskeletal protein [Sulfuriferula sp.]|nr:polymer-forming cytoskeletal protein [Sulfuriferula sp.]
MFKSSSEKAAQKNAKVQLNSNITFIGAGCKIDGDINCAGNLRIEGEISGNVVVQGDVEIAVNGRLSGDLLSADNVIVHGHVKCRINARGQLRMHKHAVVEGDVSATALDIETGARFVGYSNTGAAEAEILMLDNTVEMSKRAG